MNALFVAALCALAAGDAHAQSSQATIPIQGTWRVTEVTDSNGTNTAPQPGLYIFTRQHYSVVQVASPKPRPVVQNPSNASAAELLAVWGPSFNAQSGTYSLARGVLVLRPIVAKQPTQMAAGNAVPYDVRMQGTQLVLTARTGAIYTLTRVE